MLNFKKIKNTNKYPLLQLSTHTLIAVSVVPPGEVAKVRRFLLPEHTVEGHRSASSRQLVDTALGVSARPVKIFIPSNLPHILNCCCCVTSTPSPHCGNR